MFYLLTLLLHGKGVRSFVQVHRVDDYSSLALVNPSSLNISEEMVRIGEELLQMCFDQFLSP